MKSIAHLIRRVLLWTTVSTIRVYQKLISPALPSSCRFYPSCSHYAEEALHTHGLVHGGFLSLRRLARCHPFHPGGHDPVPGNGTSDKERENGPTNTACGRFGRARRSHLPVRLRTAAGAAGN